jgi:hypothetical protein
MFSALTVLAGEPWLIAMTSRRSGIIYGFHFFKEL